MKIFYNKFNFFSYTFLILFLLGCKISEDDSKRSTQPSVQSRKISNDKIVLDLIPKSPIPPPTSNPDPKEIEKATVLKTVENFENYTDEKPFGPTHLICYDWLEPSAEHWKTYSQYSIESENVGEPDENQYLKLWVRDDIPDATGSFKAPRSVANLNSVLRAFTISRYLEPEVDALRIKIKMLKGKIGMSFGSPVSQTGTSDVLTKVKYLSTENMDDCFPVDSGWFECDFDFNKNLLRNTRRGNFSLDANGTIKNNKNEEITYYSRWVQEALGLYVVAYDSQGNKILNGNPEILFDDIQFINKGKGQGFKDFSDATTIRTINDFEELSDLESVGTVDFRFPTAQNAPQISIEEENGKRHLQIKSKTHEENAWTAIDAADADGANAVKFNMHIFYGDNGVEAKDGDTQHIIDFLALANHGGIAFDWSSLLAPLGSFYKYLFPLEANKMNIFVETNEKKQFAIYHARRIIPRNKWVSVTIPFADFAAIFGSRGSVFHEHHKEQKPLKNSEISVIGLQTTFVNIKSFTTIKIQDVQYVFVPGSDESLRSYWQEFVFKP